MVEKKCRQVETIENKENEDIGPKEAKKLNNVPKERKGHKDKLICHVCGKEKKPYIVFMNDNIFSWIQHDRARKDGEICQRCDQYHAMTETFKDATEKEFKLAKESCEFARNMLEWWEKDKKIGGDYKVGEYLPDTTEEDKREWGGTYAIKKWYLENNKDKLK